MRWRTWRTRAWGLPPSCQAASALSPQPKLPLPPSLPLLWPATPGWLGLSGQLLQGLRAGGNLGDSQAWGPSADSHPILLASAHGFLGHGCVPDTCGTVLGWLALDTPCQHRAAPEVPLGGSQEPHLLTGRASAEATDVLELVKVWLHNTPMCWVPDCTLNGGPSSVNRISVNAIDSSCSCLAHEVQASARGHCSSHLAAGGVPSLGGLRSAGGTWGRRGWRGRACGTRAPAPAAPSPQPELTPWEH